MTSWRTTEQIYHCNRFKDWLKQWGSASDDAQRAICWDQVVWHAEQIARLTRY